MVNTSATREFVRRKGVIVAAPKILPGALRNSLPGHSEGGRTSRGDRPDEGLGSRLPSGR